MGIFNDKNKGTLPEAKGLDVGSAKTLTTGAEKASIACSGLSTGRTLSQVLRKIPWIGPNII